MGSKHLNWELKEWLAQNKEPKLLQSRFKHSMVLIGMAILKENAKEQVSFFAFCETTPERFVSEIAMMITPLILPKIHTLGQREFE